MGKYVVLTVDYELFGNGCGDPLDHIIGPMDRMARLGAECGVPFTVFVEVEEYLAFRRHAGALQSQLGYDPARLIREQIVALVRGGHDIQLHLHPEWYGAQYSQGRWTLRKECAVVDQLFESEAEVARYIGERKAVLERIIGEANPGRRVRAYRAGAFAAQPGTKLLSALASEGILIDSSLVKGLYRRAGHLELDYRETPAKDYWRVRTDVCREDSAGRVFELPVHAVMRRRFAQLDWSRLRAKFSSRIPKPHQRKLIQDLGLRPRPLSLLRFLGQTVPVKFDYHNTSPARLIRWIDAVRPAMNPNPGLDILVLIGHTKEHASDASLKRFLDRLVQMPDVKVVTLDQVATLLERSQGMAS